MRLDLFLKATRLIARRTLAQKFCDAGMVSVNNSAAKSSREIKAGDKIEIKKGNRLTKVSVTQVPDKKQVSRQDAVNLYKIISEEVLHEDAPFEINLAAGEHNSEKADF
ncbi:MAG: RNA-binding S4 domain-containing protein [Acidobacteria bacterium]|nr:RNA-binding S4 domain-containing protein [Acidobacteriota bacterium]